jgi:hypothetical protein
MSRVGFFLRRTDLERSLFSYSLARILVRYRMYCGNEFYLPDLAPASSSLSPPSCLYWKFMMRAEARQKYEPFWAAKPAICPLMFMHEAFSASFLSSTYAIQNFYILVEGETKGARNFHVALSSLNWIFILFRVFFSHSSFRSLRSLRRARLGHLAFE